MRQETPVAPGMVVSSTMQNRCASLQAFRLPFLSLGGDVLFGVFDRLTRNARPIFDVAIGSRRTGRPATGLRNLCGLRTGFACCTGDFFPDCLPHRLREFDVCPDRNLLNPP